MTATQPTVAQYMTAEPATADRGLLLSDAQQRMDMDNIRHLVVVEEGRMVGVLSTRDVAVALGLPGADPKKLTVADAMSKDPYACAATTPISDVALAMEQHRYGCAVIVDHDEVLGVFTTTDALRALRALATGQPAEAATKPQHLPPAEAFGKHHYKIRHPRPIDTHGGRLFDSRG
jgi:acetoin utilization protein AcuB